MNSSWNKVVYKFWSPFYDKIFNSGIFLAARKNFFQEVTFTTQDKILFVGVGTGADLELINHRNLNITAIDLSSDMLNRAIEKFENSSIQFINMDAQDLKFSNNSFDYVVASLVLSVVPNPQKCFQEMTRVVMENGQVLIFDKFAPKDQELSFFMKLLRPFIRLAGTDIGIKFETIFDGTIQNMLKVEDKPVMFDGMYRKILLKKLEN